MARHYLFTSESVTEGHPDKICDQISDGILDAILAKDPAGRVACETTACTGLLHIMGEITTTAIVDYAKVAREVVREIGYDRGKYGFDCDTCGVITSLIEQSPDIAMGVDKSLENKIGTDAELSEGAGDQGMMFGYACDETPELMPLPISLAQKMCKQMSVIRKTGLAAYMRPDGKSQVTVEYDENDRPVRVDTVVISTQHNPDVTLEQIRQDMIDQVVKVVVPAELLDENTKFYVNPTGRFVQGGPDHCGYLWRRRSPWRRCLLRQGPHQGGPFRCLRCPLGRQEHRGCRPCQALPGPAGLRHRCCSPCERPGGYLRHRRCQR